MKEVIFGKENFNKIMVGFDKTANAVIGTLGPKGRNVMIDDPLLPHITNDGHTIAHNISFKDKHENLGAWVVKNTSAQTNDDAGDGTTTTAVFLKEIVHESLKRPENPMVIRDSLQSACKDVVAKLKKLSKQITVEDAHKVALISAENQEIAKLVSDTIKKIGVKGVITVEESKTFETSADILEGYEANVGFMSPYFANDGKGAKASFSNVAVFCSQKKISTIMDIKPLFDQLEKAKIGELVIVCEDIDPQILGLLVANKLQGRMNLLVIKASGEELEDITATVGATLISDSTGVTFDTFNLHEHMGTATKVNCAEKKTLFIAKHKKGKEHAERLRALAKENNNQYEKEKLNKRIAKLTGGIAVIRIGASTDLERVYKKHKADDTVAAVKAALEEGVVEGGGMALWRIAQSMEANTVGEQILKKALTSPLRVICENAGKDYTEIISKMPKGHGYNAREDKYQKLVENGVIDPTKVERCALENAVSNAAVFITTHCSIVDEVEKK